MSNKSYNLKFSRQEKIENLFFLFLTHVKKVEVTILKGVVSAGKTFPEGHNAELHLRISMKISRLLARNLKNKIF